ncbi:hypothetical protein Emed_000846 [Eimeria media]
MLLLQQTTANAAATTAAAAATAAAATAAAASVKKGFLTRFISLRGCRRAAAAVVVFELLLQGPPSACITKSGGPSSKRLQLRRLRELDNCGGPFGGPLLLNTNLFSRFGAPLRVWAPQEGTLFLEERGPSIETLRGPPRRSGGPQNNSKKSTSSPVSLSKHANAGAPLQKGEGPWGALPLRKYKGAPHAYSMQCRNGPPPVVIWSNPLLSVSPPKPERPPRGLLVPPGGLPDCE